MEYAVRYDIDVENLNGTHRAVRIGWGSFAEVFRVKERVLGQDDAALIERPVVAKVFKDEQHRIAHQAFSSEVDRLQALSGHSNVVVLRGVERHRPPTFVCAECGTVFHVTHCPDCQEELTNQGELNNGKPPGLALECRNGHVFEKTKMMDWRLQRVRPCPHTGPCDVVNFLFTYCIYLEELDVNLTEYLEMMRRPAVQTRGRAIQTIADRASHPRAWAVETFLMRLSLLISIAEVLAYVHKRGFLHGDLAPENMMVSFSQPLDSTMPQQQTPRLIDFGQARVHHELRQTVLIHARPLYVAPEVKVVDNVLGNAARIEAGTALVPDAECFLSCQVPLAEGDYVFDTADGGYEVLSEEAVADSAHPAEFQAPPAASESDEPANGPESLPFDIDEREDGPVDMSESFRPRHERRYRLRVLRTPNGRLDTLTFGVNYALRIPADIYALGSVAMWLLSDGHIELLSHLQSEAIAASNRRPSTIRNMPHDVMDRAAESLALLWSQVPGTKTRRFLKQLCMEIVEVIARCLVRAQDAYAISRSSWHGENPALAVARDLRSIHERLYFFHRVRKEYAQFLRHGESDALRRLRELADSTQQQRDELARTGKEAEEQWTARIRELERENRVQTELCRQLEEQLTATTADASADAERRLGRMKEEHQSAVALLERQLSTARAEADAIRKRADATAEALAAETRTKEGLEQRAAELAASEKAALQRVNEAERRAEAATREAERLSKSLDSERRSLEQARQKLKEATDRNQRLSERVAVLEHERLPVPGDVTELRARELRERGLAFGKVAAAALANVESHLLPLVRTLNPSAAEEISKVKATTSEELSLDVTMDGDPADTDFYVSLSHSENAVEKAEARLVQMIGVLTSRMKILI